VPETPEYTPADEWCVETPDPFRYCPPSGVPLAERWFDMIISGVLGTYGCGSS